MFSNDSVYLSKHGVASRKMGTALSLFHKKALHGNRNFEYSVYHVAGRHCYLYMPSLTCTPPGRLSSPVQSISTIPFMFRRTLTIIAINILYHRLRNTTLHRIFIALSLQLGTVVVTAPCIKRPLQRIALPTEHIITVVTMTSPTARRQHNNDLPSVPAGKGKLTRHPY